MLKEVISTYRRQIFWTLPYELRRFLFRTRYPKIFRSYQEQRQTERGDFSLKPFDDHKCIFVHIPKCAGISVNKSLFGNFGGGHLTIKRYQVIFSKHEFETYFKFTFVRNPWDRLVSAFTFLKKGGINEVDRDWAEKNLSAYADFDSFVKGWVNRKNVRTWWHFKPQYKFVCDYKGALMVDFVGYYENIEADYSYIQEKIDVKTDLSHLNKSRRSKRDYREYFTEETREIVAGVYREDIELFGYTFDNASLESMLAQRSLDSFADKNRKVHLHLS